MKIITEGGKRSRLTHLTPGTVFRTDNQHFIRGGVSAHTRFYVTRLPSGEVLEMEGDEWVTPFANAQLHLGDPAK